MISNNDKYIHLLWIQLNYSLDMHAYNNTHTACVRFSEMMRNLISQTTRQTHNSQHTPFTTRTCIGSTSTLQHTAQHMLERATTIFRCVFFSVFSARIFSKPWNVNFAGFRLCLCVSYLYFEVCLCVSVSSRICLCVCVHIVLRFCHWFSILFRELPRKVYSIQGQKWNRKWQ